MRRGVSEALPAAASFVAAGQHVFLVSGREVWEYDAGKKTAARAATIGSGVRAVATWREHVAFGFESGEVVLGTRGAAGIEMQRLTAAARTR